MMTRMGRTEGRASRWKGSTLMLSAVAVLALPACGDVKDSSLCTAFGEFVGARTAVNAIDPANLNADQATEVAETYLAGVRRLEQTADGRYGQELDSLETAVNDVLLTLSAVPDDADVDTWGPLVEEDLELVADAATQVEEAIEPSCFPDTSGD
jgi:hypothetical protein